jgi:YebC/PmpR family DNA-binding regulatory protein
MSGHSKWATTKRKKAVIDSKRGAVFTKLAKNITVAAKNGKDPEMNPALRTAIEQAKAANMPKDNIEKAILKGAGELPGVMYEEVIYEAYGPGGIALLIECVTDNTNRTVSSIRAILNKYGGSLAGSGSVQYLFQHKGVIRVSTEDMTHLDHDAVELLAIDAGADDIRTEEEGITIFTPRETVHTVADVLKEQGIQTTDVSIEWMTEIMVPVATEHKQTFEKLMEALEDNEDVNIVHTNAQPDAAV